MSEYIDAEGDCFICPYCGAKIRINPEIFSGYAMYDNAEVYCEECEREFYVERTITFNYCSFRKYIYVKDGNRN